MAAKRSIPTTLFASPDFFELSSNTIRLILIGIILDADDEGRGSAHPRLLARKLDQMPEDVEHALEELASHGILRCYVVEGRSYYVLRHWHKYQVLSRPTPSSSPPPPQDEPVPAMDLPLAHLPQEHAGIPRGIQESPHNDTPEGEGEQKRKESEWEEKRTEAEEEHLPPSITRFPASGDDSGGRPSSTEHSLAETKQVASLLKLPMSDQLEAIVREFLSTPAISLVGEAIEARTWMDDPQRNRRGQVMTPAFFRRWLKRERGDYGPSASSEQPTPVPRSKARLANPSTTAAEPDQHDPTDPYQAYFLQRLAEVKERGYRQEVAS